MKNGRKPVFIKIQTKLISPSNRSTAPARSFHRALRSVASDAEASPAWHCAAEETPRPGFGPGSPGCPGSADMEGMVNPEGILIMSIYII